MTTKFQFPSLPSDELSRLAHSLSSIEISTQLQRLNDSFASHKTRHAATDTTIASVKNLGQMIKSARQEMKLNQQQLADLAGTGRLFVSELENGKESLEFSKVIRVANALGFDLVAKRR